MSPDDSELDIHDEQAAVKIQSSYRGYRTRKKLKTKAKNTEENLEQENQPETDWHLKDEELAGTKIQEGLNDLSDPCLDQTANKIQVDFQDMTTNEDIQGKESIHAEKEIDSDDPDVERAATKIQAGFRGHKVRKEMKSNKQNTKDCIPEEDHPDFAEYDLAARKIQAGYRGHKTRKVLKDMSTELGNTLSEKEGWNEDYNIDEDIDDAEAEQAATKIQAGFRGHKARKEIS